MTEMTAAIRKEKSMFKKRCLPKKKKKALEGKGFKPLCEERLSLGRISTTDSYIKYFLCPPCKPTAYNEGGEFITHYG